MSETAYPLYWPEGRKRTERYRRETGKFDVSFARARDNIIGEVQRLVGRYAPDANTVISTNIPLRRDGLPLAGQRAPEDPGVAVYFTYKKRQMTFACDRWLKIEHNMQAIAKTIEALRGIDRWGSGDMLEAAFTGFTALPAPAGAQTWWEILGVTATASADDVRSAHRRLVSLNHPDRFPEAERAAAHEKCARINTARDQGLRAMGIRA